MVNIYRSLITLFFGALGGALFYYLKTPLPWLLGAFFATLIITVTTGSLRIDSKFRMIAMPVMGVLVGSSFQPDIIDHLMIWPAGLAAAAFYTIFSSIVGFYYFTRIAKWDNPTALCAAPPGGLAEMVSIAGEIGADERRVILTHSIRIAIVVVLATFTIQYILDFNTTDMLAPLDIPAPISLVEWLILGACAVTGGYLGPKLGLPGGAILGAKLVSAGVHIVGISDASPPNWIVATVQIVLGASLGVRFLGITKHEATSFAVHSAIWSIILLSIAFALAAILSPLIGFDQRALFLGFAPGGFSEMLLVALAIGIESAFVATCHVIRLIAIFICVPLAASLLQRHKNEQFNKRDLSN